jgi:hypothetical protein
MSRRGDSAVGQCRLVISEPKTTHSRREVSLHATTVSMLRKHRIAQMEERMAAANFWIDGIVNLFGNACGAVDVSDSVAECSG